MRLLKRYYFTVDRNTRLRFRHYLRALLREVSYLPDPFARRYHHQDVLQRFRQYIPRKEVDTTRPVRSPQKFIRDDEHLAECLEKCQEKLSWYYRAGNGDFKALTKALGYAYGRVGKRKHQLLAPYLQAEIPRNPKELEAALNPAPSLKLKLPQAVETILKQQGKQSDVDISTGRYMKPVLPETNLWGRPMPQKRVVNAKKKMLLMLTEKILPPLPQEEFNRLQDLANGTIPCPVMPKRRKRLEGLGLLPKMTANHAITPRTMRRIWARLLLFCSTIQHDPAKGKWIVTWGSTILSPSDSLEPDGRELRLFKDAEGKPWHRSN